MLVCKLFSVLLMFTHILLLFLHSCTFLYSVFQKTVHLTFVHNFGKPATFFHRQIPEETLYTSIVKILRLNLLHYLVQLENYNCCRLQLHTIRAILHNMRPRLRSESYDYKIGKKMQQCSEGFAMSAN